MAAPTVVGTSAWATGTTAVAPTWPTNAAGDFAVLVAHSKPGNIQTALAGWTAAGYYISQTALAQAADAGDTGTYVWVRDVPSTQAGTVSASLTSGNSSGGYITVLRGAAGSTWSWEFMGAADNVSGSTTWLPTVRSMFKPHFAPTGLNNNSFDCAYANNTWVVVSNSGGVIVCTTTPDQSANWSVASGRPNTTALLRGVATDGTTWVAVGNAGNIWHSTTPSSTWTAVATGGSAQFTSVATNGSIWVAMGLSGTCYTATTPSGTWTARTSTFSTSAINRVYYSADDGAFVAVGDAGKIASSTTGTSWTSRTNGFAGTDAIQDVVYGDGRWTAVGAGKAYYATTHSGSWTALTLSADPATGATISSTSTNVVGYGNGAHVFGFVTSAAGGLGNYWEPSVSTTTQPCFLYSPPSNQFLKYLGGWWVAGGGNGSSPWITATSQDPRGIAAQTDDLVIPVYGVPGDLQALSVPVINAGGAGGTLTSVTQSPAANLSSGTGNDIGAMAGYAAYTASPTRAYATPYWTATSSNAATYGSGVLLKVRATGGAVPTPPQDYRRSNMPGTRRGEAVYRMAQQMARRF